MTYHPARHSGTPPRVSAIVWNAVRDQLGMGVRDQWNAQPFDITEQLEPLVSSARVRAEHKGLHLECLWNTPHRMLIGDPVRVQQIVGNLLDNAIKFTDSGYIRIRLKTTVTQDDLVQVEGVVSDTGIGIDEEGLKRLFHPFSQADETISRQFGGTGLGLTLCRELCERMGGGIRALRREPKGMSFQFFIRLSPARGMSPFIDTLPGEKFDSRALSSRHVLIADDNRVNQTLLKRWLSDEGMRVSIVGDGESAVNAVVATHFDAVLMDISMPVMNGLVATRAIRALDGKGGCIPARRYATLPIIGISAHAMDGDREQCLDQGMTDYVTKPIRRDHLLAKISQALAACDVAESTLAMSRCLLNA